MEDGRCVPTCPVRHPYNPQTAEFGPLDSDGKFSYGRECVTSCPSETLKIETVN